MIIPEMAWSVYVWVLIYFVLMLPIVGNRIKLARLDSDNPSWPRAIFAIIVAIILVLPICGWWCVSKPVTPNVFGSSTVTISKYKVGKRMAFDKREWHKYIDHGDGTVTLYLQ